MAHSESQEFRPLGICAGGLLEKWCSDQVAAMQGWVDRLMHQENWKPVARDKGCARSASLRHSVS